ncbi:MAG: Cell division protein FtsW [Deltaproteobacteria bacterium]|nr:Cell division protein FtsW [Deltaproteobacteria bacterium]
MPRLNRPDPWLLIAAAGLVGLGIVMVFNASYFHAQERYADPLIFFRKHLFAVACGATLLVLVSRVRLEWFDRLAYPALIAIMIALVLVLVPGVGIARGGARRWVGIGPFNFQPSEFAKMIVVLYLARSIAHKRERMKEFFAGVVPHLVVVGVCALLVVVQPDFGTAAILVLVLALMLFGGGARPAHLIGLALLALPVVGFALIRAPYRWRRILAFVDPWRYSQDIAFQLVQSLIAFGSGGMAGIGLGQSKQKMFYLPEAHTDFIFALIGEELGFLGAMAVLALFAIVGIRGFRIALRHPDGFASMLALGMTLVILLEAVVNVGVVLGLLPTKGLALPFLSYGGSALIGTLVEVGILASLSRMTG